MKNKLMKKIEVVAAVIESNSKYLAVQKGETKHEHSSYKWEFPGGKIEQGETQQQALIREIQEELDLEITKLDFLCTVNHQYPNFELVMHCFICPVEKPKFKLNEHIAYNWLDLNKLKGFDWAAADLPVIDSLINSK